MAAVDGRFAHFEGVVTSLEEIRATIGEPLPPVVAKVIDHLDDLCRAFIERCPFIVIASAGNASYGVAREYAQVWVKYAKNLIAFVGYQDPLEAGSQLIQSVSA